MEIVTGSGDSQYDLREAQMRKKRSIEILKAHNVPYTPHLPTIETADAVRVRTAEEIARRAVTCLLAIQVACDAAGAPGNFKKSRKFFGEKLTEFGLEGFLTHIRRGKFLKESATVRILPI